MSLTLPKPGFTLDPPGGPAKIEEPVTVTLPPIPVEGSPASQETLPELGLFVFRGAPGSEEIWDAGVKAWAPVPSDLASLTSQPFIPDTETPDGWSSPLVAVGQKDGTGAPVFETQAEGGPVYRLRAYGRAQDGTAAVSPPSDDLTFASLAETRRFIIEFDTNSPEDAQLARILLRNASLQPAGHVELRATGGHEVEIVNFAPGGAALARVTLTAQGDLRLEPASGRQIVLDGTVEAGRISYLPSAGGGRQWL